jgi:hypothetical protein
MSELTYFSLLFLQVLSNLLQVLSAHLRWCYKYLLLFDREFDN